MSDLRRHDPLLYYQLLRWTKTRYSKSERLSIELSALKDELARMDENLRRTSLNITVDDYFRMSHEERDTWRASLTSDQVIEFGHAVAMASLPPPLGMLTGLI
jgi:hypothetical protein